MTYDEFKALVRDLAHRDDLTTHGLLPIPTLRQESGAELTRAQIDEFLMRMHGEGVVHLLSHVEFDALPAPVRHAALHLPSGQQLYWIRTL